MDKYAVGFVLATACYVLLCIGVLFAPWLMLPVLVCVIAFSIWVEPMPLGSELHLVLLVAEAFATVCALGSVLLHSDLSISTMQTLLPTMQQQALQFGYFLCASVCVIFVGRLLSTTFEHHVAPVIHRRLLARALRDMEYYRLKDSDFVKIDKVKAHPKSVDDWE